MLKTITKITIGLLAAASISTQAQTFVEANSLTGFNNTFTGIFTSSIAFSDVNSDGKPDILITGSVDGYSDTSIAKLYTNSGTNFSEVIGTPFTGVLEGSIAFSDVNSDGKPDVLITGGSVNGLGIAKLYTNSGTNFSEVLGTPFIGVEWGSIAFSDVNSDGKPDVLITGYSDSGYIVKLYTNSGTNFSEVLDTPFTGVWLSSIAFSDVNSDGKPDVLITGHSDFGPIVKLYLNQFVFATLIVSQPTSDTVCGGTMQSFAVSATGDNLSYLWSNNATTTSINTSIAGTYFVTVTGNNGIVVSNAAQLIVHPCSVTGFSSSIAPYSFEIYPNPNSGSFYIDAIAGSDGIYTISAIDGKVLATGKLAVGKNTIDTNLPKGFYLLKVGSATKKLIIE